MAIEPTKSQIKKLVPLLAKGYDSPEEAAAVIMEKAWQLYEERAKYFAVAQVKPATGRYVDKEAADASKVVLGPFVTYNQAYAASRSLTYGNPTSEEALAWPIEVWYGTPNAWYEDRKKKYGPKLDWREHPRQARQQEREQFWVDNPGATELPLYLQGDGWDGLAEYQTYKEEDEDESRD